MAGMFRIAPAETDSEIRACLKLLKQLRADLDDGEAGVAKIRRQMAQGYRMMASYSGQDPVSLAGYRFVENTVRGKTLYVDDLVTDANARSKRHGEALIAALADEARDAGCTALVLDSSVSNAKAHRFYLKAGFDIVGFHFAAPLERFGKPD